MNNLQNSRLKPASIKDFFRPRVKTEIKREPEIELSLFESDEDNSEQDNQYYQTPICKSEDSVVENDLAKAETLSSEPEITLTHYVTPTISTDDFGWDDVPQTRKRIILLDDEFDDKAPKVKQIKEVVKDNLANGKDNEDRNKYNGEWNEDRFRDEEDTQQTEREKEKNEDTNSEYKDELDCYQYSEKVAMTSSNVTVGEEDEKSQEDYIDYNERELYMNCKPSFTSLGFRSYVDNYYRYKGSFSFPPWLEVKNIRDINGYTPLEDEYNPGTLWIPPKNHKWAKQYRACHYTECMQQWWNIKQNQFDALVFFKMGKFYELFYHDACIIQNIVNLRWMGTETKPHVGFPEKSLHIYASACVNAGYRVVVVEQTETPQQLEKRNKETGKYEKAVKRDVCEIITPGTVVRPEMLGKQSRPLVVLTTCPDPDTRKYLYVVSIDVSMTKVRFGSVKYSPDFLQLKTVLVHLCPAEMVLDRNLMTNKDLLRIIRALPYPPEISRYHENSGEHETLFQRVSELHPEEALECKPALVLTESYLKYILMDKLVEYCFVEPIKASEFEVMKMDYSAITHLELFMTQEGNTKNSLFDYMNNTSTAFGERMLREWLLNPLTDVDVISKRSECVAFLVKNFPLVTTMKHDLDKFPDLERSLGKVLNNVSNYHKKAVYFDSGVFVKLYELYNLFEKIKRLEDIIVLFFDQSLDLFDDEVRSELIAEMNKNYIRCSVDVVQYKNKFKFTEDKKCQSLNWNKSIEIQVEIKNITDKLDEVLAEIQKSCPSATYVNCKFRFEVEMTESEFQKYLKNNNKMEITSTRSGFVRSRNSKILQILNELEDAEFRLKESEEEFYQYIVRDFHKNSFKFCKLIETAAILDCLASFATVAKNSAFPMTRPILHSKDKNILKIENSFYPIFNVNQNKFVPNDICLGDFEESDTPIVIITGPNMGGKSTLLRQIALTIIMGQMGSFVAASSCEFSVVDSVFTRLGASDNLLQGKSTFLVELQDISSILLKATPSSLALIDELGRGTSTFDGTAIAVATLEKISKIGCRCVFTTHFQDVCSSARAFRNISMFHMSCKLDEETHNVEFLYKLVPGVCPDSHGLHVAKLAKIPDRVLEMAKKASLRLHNSGCKKQEEENNKSLRGEILYAHRTGNIEIEYEDNPINSIVKYFTDSGFIISDGSKFGGDLVIYSGAGPELSHSKYLLFILERNVTWREIISYYRVASQSAKIPLIALKYSTNKIRILKLDKYDK